MIRIGRIYSTVTPGDRERVEQVQEIFRQNFATEAGYAEKIPDMLDRPFAYGYRTLLLTSNAALRRVTGFSLVLYFPKQDFALLDFIAVGRNIRGGGLGSALYEATREYLADMKARGLYLEALPDDPAVVHDAALLQENRRRLRFYEHYDVRPIVGTAYETPIGASPAPYLLFDGLGRSEPLGRAECRAAMRTLLEAKYSHLVGPDYVRRVVDSVRDDPVRFRPPRYVTRTPARSEVRPTGRIEKSLVLVTSGHHEIHHVRERGYVERPARVTALRDALAATGLFAERPARHFGEEHIRAVHDADFVTYLKVVCEKLDSARPVYPYVFPIRRPERKPKELAVRAGYYCIDTFTPLDRNAYTAARGAVDTAMTAAEEVLGGRPLAYALCRPPGHHAQRRVFGGFCYFNNASIAAHRLAGQGRVALLDIDFHHGNGHQDIFWRRDDVLTQSIHGHPNYAYPYFSGFADETGEGPGAGYNRNYPLPENAGIDAYLAAFEKAMARIAKYKPVFLVVSLGLDTMRGDPTGAFGLTASALSAMGRKLGQLALPTVVVQEGGYSLRNLRRGAPAFFRGLAHGLSDASA